MTRLIFIFFAMCSALHAQVTWGERQTIAETGTAPVVRADGNGNAISVWIETGGQEIKASKFEDETGVWASPITISTTAPAMGAEFTGLRLAVDMDGNAIAVWTQILFGNSSNLRGVIYDPVTDEWSATDILISANQGFGPSASSPTVAVDNNGNALVAWTRNSLIISFRSLAFDGVEWDPPLASGPTDATSSAQNPEPNTPVTVAYFSGGQINGAMTAIANDVGGGLTMVPIGVVFPVEGEEFNTTTFTSESSGTAASTIATNPTGNAIVIWAVEIMGSYSIGYALFNPENMTWLMPGTPVFTPSPGTALVMPQIAVAPDGNAVAVWVADDGDTSVQASFFVREGMDGIWQTPETISTSSDATAPQIAVSPQGTYTVAWQQNGQVVSRVFNQQGDEVWLPALEEEPTQITDQNTGSSPQVAFNQTNGEVFAVWEGSIAGAVGTVPTTPEGFAVVQAEQKLHRFPAQGDLINVISWEAVDPTGIVSWRLFRGNTLLIQTTAMSYEDHQRVPHVAEIYFLTALNAMEEEVFTVNFVVAPLQL